MPKDGEPKDREGDVGECLPDQEGEFFFVLGFRPWVHYAPVKPDLSDLVSVLKKLRGDEKLAKELARNGRNFYETRLQPKQILAYAATALALVAEQEAPLSGNWTESWLQQRGFLPAPSPYEGLDGLHRFRSQDRRVEAARSSFVQGAHIRRLGDSKAAGVTSSHEPSPGGTFAALSERA